jgi:hypothetical protein
MDVYAVVTDCDVHSLASFKAAIILDATLLLLLPLPLNLRLCRFNGSETVLIGRPMLVGCIGK